MNIATTNSIAARADEYAESGLSVLPIKTDGSKSPKGDRLPGGKWEPYQERIADDGERQGLFRAPAVGIGIIGGAVSANLEIIDFDRADLFTPFRVEVELLAPGLVGKLPLVKTPGGYHLYLRCDAIEGNQKLAQYPAENEAGQVIAKTGIETRGEGGYVVAPGSPVECHSTGRLYQHVAGPAITSTPTITIEQRAILFRAARSLDQWFDDEPIEAKRAKSKGGDHQAEHSGLMPGDDFAARTSWPEILEPAGWREHHTSGERTYWVRPGKDEQGWSATTGITSREGNELLCVFSTNAHPFTVSAGKPCGTFGKFGAYAILNHGADFAAAAKALYAEGYGDRVKASDRDKNNGSDKPKITVTTDEPAVINAAVASLEADPRIYTRGGMLVTVVRDEHKVKGIKRVVGSPRIIALPIPSLRERLAGCAKYVRNKEVGENWVEQDCHPPEWLVKAVDARGEWPNLPRLAGIVEEPTLRPDGTVLDEPGYDEDTALLYEPSGQFPRAPDHPSRVDAEAAALSLLGVMADFPAKDQGHRSAWLAAVLTVVARWAFDGPAPLTAIEANVRGAGKSLLADAIALIATGRSIARMENPDDNAEMRKRITALALEGERIVLLDNIENVLGCPALNAALTGTTWKDRILGSNRSTSSLPLVTVWLATGNNLQFDGDTTRRCLRIRLESPDERPEERTGFQHPELLPWIREQRPRLVIAALTILRAYCAAGRPPMGLKPWGSYEAWSGLIRNALVFARQPDPAETREELLKDCDKEAAGLRGLLAGWLEVAGSGGMTVSEVYAELGDRPGMYQTLRDAIADLLSTKPGHLPSTRSLGSKLHHLRGRVIDGRAFSSVQNRAGTAVWSVQQLGSPPVQGLPGLQGLS